MATAAITAGLLYEGLAVNALAHCGVSFVGCDTNLVECAVVFVAAVILTLLYRTFDRGVGRFVIHNLNLPLLNLSRNIDSNIILCKDKHV